MGCTESQPAGAAASPKPAPSPVKASAARPQAQRVAATPPPALDNGGGGGGGGGGTAEEDKNVTNPPPAPSSASQPTASAAAATPTAENPSPDESRPPLESRSSDFGVIVLENEPMVHSCSSSSSMHEDAAAAAADAPTTSPPSREHQPLSPSSPAQEVEGFGCVTVEAPPCSHSPLSPGQASNASFGSLSPPRRQASASPNRLGFAVGPSRKSSLILNPGASMSSFFSSSSKKKEEDRPDIVIGQTPRYPPCLVTSRGKPAQQGRVGLVHKRVSFDLSSVEKPGTKPAVNVDSDGDDSEYGDDDMLANTTGGKGIRTGRPTPMNKFGLIRTNSSSGGSKSGSGAAAAAAAPAPAAAAAAEQPPSSSPAPAATLSPTPAAEAGPKSGGRRTGKRGEGLTLPSMAPAATAHHDGQCFTLETQPATPNTAVMGTASPPSSSGLSPFADRQPAGAAAATTSTTKRRQGTPAVTGSSPGGRKSGFLDVNPPNVATGSSSSSSSTRQKSKGGGSSSG
eukprot:Rhum_TRINITY_DN14611_c28_g1::Rhum_TRINITY_DN14611_c28_g1_i1::g.103478::m.103478